MASYHTVKQGEHVSSIAHEYGFTDYTIVWQHPNNADLKSSRQNPNVLFPGDRLFIPDRVEHEEPSCDTDQMHRFELRTQTLKLRLILEDLYEKPIANAQCDLRLEDGLQRVHTDGDGRIELKIAPTDRTAVLVIKDTQTAFGGVEIPIKIGHLDPVEEISGQRERLNNLGYFPGTGDGPDAAESFRSAVEEFQCDHPPLKVDGVCGAITQAKLKQVHGS